MSSSTNLSSSSAASRASLSNVLVLKFGSSVFTTERDAQAIVAEIGRHVQKGRRVVVVVSALWGQTDRLLDSARKVANQPAGSGLAALLATGEQAAATLLSLALQGAGLAAVRLDARTAGIIAQGPALDATPVALDTRAVSAALAKAPVVVIPGYVAQSPTGETVVLGRGGSDLSAVFIAAELGAEVRLVKDVDGVFERDPLAFYAGPAPRRYRTIEYDLIPSVAGKLVQPKAALFAKDRGLNVRVVALGSDLGTLITSATELEPAPEVRVVNPGTPVAIPGRNAADRSDWRTSTDAPTPAPIRAIA